MRLIDVDANNLVNFGCIWITDRQRSKTILVALLGDNAAANTDLKRGDGDQSNS